MATGIHYTGRTSDLGDELCVTLATSDWGENGWMVCEEVRAPGRRPFVTPKVFMGGTDEASLEEAMDLAKTGSFYGYAATKVA